MIIDYKRVNSFENIKTDINAEVIEGRKNFNFIKGFEFQTDLLRSDGGQDEVIARQWMAFEKPDDLIFNHGEYITEQGFYHIIQELNSKRDSNRALYSLLDYNKICKKGDDPIPSFLIFQVTIENNILYVACYFRALEVVNFLPINLQEIKLNLYKIHTECNLTYVNTIRLAVYAFNAYKKADQKIPSILKIDRLDSMDLMEMICDISKHADLIRMIREKRGVETYISLGWVESFIKILSKHSTLIQESNIKNNLEPLRLKLEALLEIYKNLRILREKHSHATRIDDENIKANNIIDEILGLV